MGPVPVMRGLLVQPRATVQDDGSKRAGDRAGSRRQAPGTQRLPAHPIMTEPSDTGTHSTDLVSRTFCCPSLRGEQDNDQIWLWVPACAGTTPQRLASLLP